MVSIPTPCEKSWQNVDVFPPLFLTMTVLLLSILSLSPSVAFYTEATDKKGSPDGTKNTKLSSISRDGLVFCDLNLLQIPTYRA